MIHPVSFQSQPWRHALPDAPGSQQGLRKRKMAANIDISGIFFPAAIAKAKVLHTAAACNSRCASQSRDTIRRQKTGLGGKRESQLVHLESCFL